MAHLKLDRLSLPCNRDGLSYFPSGFRDVLKCEFVASNGTRGLSEWAPLLGIHAHSIPHVVDLLSTIDPRAIDDAFSQLQKNDSDYLADYLRASFPYPVSFIVSMALLYAQIKYGTYCFQSNINMSSLIMPHHSIDYIKLMRERGCRCLKIKINGADSHDIERIQLIRSLVDNEVDLRLDANKKLSFCEAKTLLHALKPLRIDYIEEPIWDISRLSELYDETGVDMALDESFCEEDALLMCRETKSKYLIIKASRFTSVYSVMNLCRKAQAIGVSPIFSPCFESDFYCGLMMHLVDSLGLHNNAHGIYTDIWA